MALFSRDAQRSAPTDALRSASRLNKPRAIPDRVKYLDIRREGTSACPLPSGNGPMLATRVTCPFCSKHLKTGKPLEVGKRVLCSGCGRSFSVQPDTIREANSPPSDVV